MEGEWGGWGGKVPEGTEEEVADSAAPQVCAVGGPVPSVESSENHSPPTVQPTPPPQALVPLVSLLQALSLGGPKEADCFPGTSHPLLNIVFHQSLSSPLWTRSSVPADGPEVGRERHGAEGQGVASRGLGHARRWADERQAPSPSRSLALWPVTRTARGAALSRCTRAQVREAGNGGWAVPGAETRSTPDKRQPKENSLHLGRVFSLYWENMQMKGPHSLTGQISPRRAAGGTGASREPGHRAPRRAGARGGRRGGLGGLRPGPRGRRPRRGLLAPRCGRFRRRLQARRSAGWPRRGACRPPQRPPGPRRGAPARRRALRGAPAAPGSAAALLPRPDGAGAGASGGGGGGGGPAVAEPGRPARPQPGARNAPARAPSAGAEPRRAGRAPRPPAAPAQPCVNC